MSKQSMDVLLTMAAIALYTEHGVISAIHYLRRAGWTNEEAVDMLALYDHYKALAKASSTFHPPE